MSELLADGSGPLLRALFSVGPFANGAIRVAAAVVASVQPKMFYLLTFWALTAETPWHLADTGIYDRLFVQQVALDDQGGFYLLDKSEKVVRRYSKTGKPLSPIGGPGQGPGEFLNPTRIFYYQNRVYVVEWQLIHEFSLDGDSVSRIRKPQGYLHFEKVVDGWVGMFGLYPGDREKPTKLVWFSQDLSQKKVLGEWSSEYSRNPSPNPFDPNIEYFNPLPDVTQICLNRDRTVVAVKLQSGKEVLGFDIEKKVKSFSITMDDPGIAFNQSWGEEVLRRAKSHYRQVGIQDIQLKPGFPEYLPCIEAIYLLPGDRLMVRQPKLGFYGKEGLAERFQCHVFDFDGRNAPPNPMDVHAGRTVALVSDVVFFLYVDRDEMWTIAMIARHRARQYFEDHPLPGFKLEMP